MSTEREKLSNPYFSADDPLFFGRSNVFGWIAETITTNRTAPLVLHGRARAGKTAVVQRIATGRFPTEALTVLVDAETFAADHKPTSLGGWLRPLAHRCAEVIAAAGIEIDPVVDEAFERDAGAAFRGQILQPLFSQGEKRPLLVILDHVDELLSRDSVQQLLSFWQETLYQHDNLHLLMTLRNHPDQYGNLLPFTGDTFELGPLTESAGQLLLRRPVPYYLYDDVVHYIMRLTGGYPDRIQRVAHQLFERWRTGGMTQLGLADVMAVVRGLPADEVADWPREQANTKVATADTRPSGRGRRVLALVVVLAALVAATLTLTPAVAMGQQYLWGEIYATATAEASRIAARNLALTLTPDVTPTGTPTDTPTSTPTHTPTSTPTSTSTPTVTPTPSITPTPEPETAVRDTDMMPMALIPAGSYPRGTAGEIDPDDPLSGDADERPQQEVAISEFYLDQFEVSVSQYITFLNTVPGSHADICGPVECVGVSPERSGSFIVASRGVSNTYFAANPDTLDFPASYVSWFGARAYCEWVDARLPTEAEWEYAARGEEGRLYPWGDEEPDRSRAVFGTEITRLLPVDALPQGATPRNVYGLAGGVWEWTADWYDETYYEWGPTTDPAGPPTGSERVTRGGSWTLDTDAARLRAANRNWFRPTAIRADVGFRCARDVAP